MRTTLTCVGSHVLDTRGQGVLVGRFKRVGGVFDAYALPRSPSK